MASGGEGDLLPWVFDATIDPRLLAVTLLATPAAAWLGLSALRRGAVSVERVG